MYGWTSRKVFVHGWSWYVFLNITILIINIFYKPFILFPSYLSKLTLFQCNFNLSSLLNNFMWNYSDSFWWCWYFSKIINLNENPIIAIICEMKEMFEFEFNFCARIKNKSSLAREKKKNEKTWIGFLFLWKDIWHVWFSVYMLFTKHTYKHYHLKNYRLTHKSIMERLKYLIS